MNNDIRPPQPRRAIDSFRPTYAPKRPLGPTVPSMRPQPVIPAPQPLELPSVPEITPKQDLRMTGSSKKPRSFAKKLLLWVAIFVGLVVVAAIGLFVWYQAELGPVTADANAAPIRITIVSGTNPDIIASQLADKKVIKNAFAFSIYAKLSGARGLLQAGTFSLSPHDSTQAIVTHLTSGKSDELKLTFLPGATVADNKKVLIKAGFSKADVDTAFAKSYSSPIFAGKPDSAGLEGYVYGETYNFSASATPEEVLERTFTEFNTKIESNHLVAGFKKQGLSLYQGITLASIIQRETSSKDANTPSSDQKQVAQVFYSRLAVNLPLGSDVTAYYGADQIGATRAVTVDTPYNTRIHPGLPPGPIATPGLGALLAATTPAAGNYMYFLSGDDNVTYFSRTDAEHQQTIVSHCKVKCAVK